MTTQIPEPADRTRVGWLSSYYVLAEVYERDDSEASGAHYGPGQVWWRCGADEGPATWAEVLKATRMWDGPYLVTLTPIGGAA